MDTVYGVRAISAFIRTQYIASLQCTYKFTKTSSQCQYLHAGKTISLHKKLHNALHYVYNALRYIQNTLRYVQNALRYIVFTCLPTVTNRTITNFLCGLMQKRRECIKTKTTIILSFRQSVATRNL